MIRIDCHFHPNFPFFLGERAVRRHARALWKAFAKRRLDAVFVAEHAFKHPIRSYEALRKERPKNTRTVLIPAVEALSREGIDMIVFSRDTHVYTRKDILTPYKLTIEQLIARVRRDPRLYGVIAHPCIPSDTGILRHRSEAATRKDERLTRFVEEFNASLLPLRTLITAWHGERLLRGMFRRVNRTIRLPARLIPRGVVALGGSDAHHVWDMGSCLLIHARRPRTDAALFRAIVSRRSRRTFLWRPQRHPLASLLLDGLTALRERITKIWGLYRVDTPRTLAIQRGLQ